MIYLTVGAVMIPMNRIRHQLRAWLAGKTKMCLRKNVFNSVSCEKKKEQMIKRTIVKNKSKYSIVYNYSDSRTFLFILTY